MTFRCTSCKGPMPIVDGHRDAFRCLVPCRVCSQEDSRLAAAEKARRRQIPAADSPAARHPRAEEQLDSLEWIHSRVDHGATAVYAPVDTDLVEIASVCEAEPSIADSEDPLTAAESMRLLLERVRVALDLDRTDPDDAQIEIPMCPRFATAFRESRSRLGEIEPRAPFRPTSPDERAADQHSNRTFNVLASVARLNNAAMLLSSYLEQLIPNLRGNGQGWTDVAVEVSGLLGLLQSELVRANGRAVASVVNLRSWLLLARCSLQRK